MNRLFHNVADACANAVPDTDMYWNRLDLRANTSLFLIIHDEA